jgi:hypothetical protein
MPTAGVAGGDTGGSPGVARAAHVRKGRPEIEGVGYNQDMPVDFAALFAGLSTAYLVLNTDLVIVEANEAYLHLLQRTRQELVGRPVFQAFPPETASLDAQGRNPLQMSFERVRDTGLTDRMPLLQYDVRDPGTGRVEQRFWSLIHSAVLGEDGRPALVLRRVEDVTDFARERERERSRGLDWRRRAERVEADLYTRAQELRAALQAQQTASRRLAGLAEAALQLAAANRLRSWSTTSSRPG